MQSVPFVSIIIVNFNGRHLLDDCLSSLRKLEFPKNKLEILVVDNNSSDDSIPFLLKKFPEVHVIPSERNLGFAGGNILGFQKAKGEYIVLLNSDVTVDPQWLSALVDSAKDPKVGIVCSRLRYALPFIELVIESATVPRSKIFNTIDHSPIGVLVEDIFCATEDVNTLVYYKQGFYDKREGEISTRRISGSAKILLPFDPAKEMNEYIITLHGLESIEPMKTPVSLQINDLEKKVLLQSHETQQVSLQVKNKDVRGSYHWLIQNAGNIVMSNGFSKDRGSVVLRRDNERREFYEEESAYFLQPAKLLAACGASMLIKRKVIDQVGFFDDVFFMYYEDIELSMRAWRAGWKILYQPASIGYHKHRATTGESESVFFLSQTESNHLLFMIKHFPSMAIVRQLGFFLLSFFMTTVKSFVFQFRDDEVRARVWKIKFEGRKVALKRVAHALPRSIKARWELHQRWPIDYQKLQEVTY